MLLNFQNCEVTLVNSPIKTWLVCLYRHCLNMHHPSCLIWCVVSFSQEGFLTKHSKFAHNDLEKISLYPS